MITLPSSGNSPAFVPLRRLSDAQNEKLYEACLTILERTGVQVYEQEAIDLLKSAGVSNIDGNRVRIPSKLVEFARSTAPNQVTLYNRYGEPVMPVGGRRSFFGTGSDCLHIIDHRTNQRRAAVMKDVDQGVTVVDALPNIDFTMCMFLPSDVRQSVADRYAMAAMLKHTTKPNVYVTTEFSGCVDAVAMAEAVMGGEEALRQKPLAACYINVTTGLVHNEEAVQKLLYLSEKDLPFMYVPSTQGGMTAPVTVPGALAVAQAGALVGLVLSQLKREGAPFIAPGWGGNMLDMRTTTQPYADPDKRLTAADQAHWLDLPMFSLAGVSDSKVVDQQAAAEMAMTLMAEALAGTHIVHDLGYLESGLTGSLPQVVIGNEVLNWLTRFIQPIEINDETLALDLIDEVGPDGEFLGSDHTFEHFRERWYPDLFERANYDQWMVEGGKTLGERAADRVEEILSTHQPDPLPPDVLEKIELIIQRAEQENHV